jgi:hypothetical protein
LLSERLTRRRPWPAGIVALTERNQRPALMWWLVVEACLDEYVRASACVL